MQLVINGETKEVGPVATVAQLITALDLGEGKVAVELNGKVVPRSAHDKQNLAANDKLEIVQAIGGG
ncbi:MAG: sulfur carrier protein ThiS [Pseudohongiellaceae bacterium]